MLGVRNILGIEGPARFAVGVFRGRTVAKPPLERHGDGPTQSNQPLE